MTVIYVVSWKYQFIAHDVYEKRVPAFADNKLLYYSAPFFVTAEVLRYFGWKKNEFKSIDKDIEQRVIRYKDSLLKKAN